MHCWFEIHEEVVEKLLPILVWLISRVFLSFYRANPFEQGEGLDYGSSSHLFITDYVIIVQIETKPRVHMLMVYFEIKPFKTKTEP